MIYNTPRRDAFALVFVLALIVLIATLLVGFLLSASTERSAAGGFAAASSARQFADTAVSIVQSQINHATTRGSNVAWISQPGMVRTFDTSGNLVNAYKLYSAGGMIRNAVDLNEDLPPAGTSPWMQRPALWVDLNAPITANGVKNFPILPFSDTPGPTDPSPNAPIDGVGPVEGFSLVKANTPGATTYQPAPMPVRWLYILQDGTVAAPNPTRSSGKVAVIDEETPGNPVVGRIGFWTDDETCKVNLNTASEGVHWDTPHGFTKTEISNALYQPARGEYQRYPGHPAGVALSTIFPGLAPEDLYTLTPRVVGEKDNPNGLGWTSRGGTQIPRSVTDFYNSTLGVKTDGNRLFASIDELMFAPGLDASNQRVSNSLISKNVLETRRFFVTAQSRAPETTLSNLPRIACWPIQRLNSSNQLDVAKTNAFDRTIALCASTGAVNTPSFRPYFFQRELSMDPDNDFQNITRNGELYSYLQQLTGRAIPGFGPDTFAAKYNDDRDQILTQIFDYIRCSNLYDDTLSPGNQFTNLMAGTVRPVSSPWGSAGSTVPANTFTGDPGHGFVAPIHGPNSTMGQGRFLTLRKLTIIFIACADPDNATSNEIVTSAIRGLKGNQMLKEPYPTGPLTALLPGQLRVQAFVVPELYSTATGWRVYDPDIRVQIDGLDQLKLNNQFLRFPAGGWASYISSAHSLTGDSNNTNRGGNYGGSLINNAILYKKATNKPSTMPLTSTQTNYCFISAPITISKGASMQFSGGSSVRVSILAGSLNPKLEQTVNVEMKDEALPLPTLHSNYEYWTFFSDGPYSPLVSYGRLTVDNANAANRDQYVPGVDVARSWIPKHSDYRLIASSQGVAKGVFMPHPNQGEGAPIVSGAGYLNPDIPKNLFGAGLYGNPAAPADATGDFDTAPGSVQADGAGINKPDEGDIYRESSTTALTAGDGKTIPYYSYASKTSTSGATFFSPNRIIPSPVMFGSLPTGVKAGVPWRTLLFRPKAAHETHIGANAPKDHLLLDYFWMPVVEPYAISDRFSTAGKINLNYQIIPFTWIDRSSALRAVLKPEKVTRIGTTVPGGALHPNIYSSSGAANQTLLNQTGDYRIPLDLTETLSQFTARFNQADKNRNVFISASEICDLHMVPQGSTASDMQWTNYRQTGDNLREKIYATVYPKVTTRSNTFTVHFRAQSLKKARTSTSGSWTEGRDAVTGEYRGSTTIERFIDSNATIPDYPAAPASIGTTSGPKLLDTCYRWRVIQNRQFAP